MTNYNEMTYSEQQKVAELFANWLKNYTKEVIMRVMAQRDDILANEFALKLLRELKEREDNEQEDFKRSMESLLDHFDIYKEYDPHNHVLEHSNSYRDVLYDMYIRG